MNKKQNYLYAFVSVLMIGAGSILCSPNVRADANGQTAQAAETNSVKQNLHSNDSITDPVNWNNWQKNPTLNPVLSVDIDNHNLPEATDVISLDTGWETKGDTVATATLNKTLTWMVIGRNVQDEDYSSLKSVLVNNINMPLSETRTDQFAYPLENGYGTAFSIPLGNYISTDSISTNGNTKIKGKVVITHTNPRYSMTLYQLNPDLLTVDNPQVVRVFYKDSETGKDIYPSVTLGEKGISQQNLPAVSAPKISGYSLRGNKPTEYQSASVSKEAFLKTVQELPGDIFKDPKLLTMLSKEYDDSFGENPLSSLSNYVYQNLANQGFPNLPYGLAFVMVALAYDKKSTNLFDYLQTNVTKYSDSDTIQNLKLSTNPQAVIFWYNKDSSTPTTPTVPTTPSAPTTSSSSSSSASTSSTSSSTPITSSPSSAPSDDANLPSYVAVKGAVVYSVNKIGLYKSTKFSAANRSAWYAKKPRINRPMFVVTGYKRAANGALRYQVRDVNHTSKTDGQKGYITASQKYVRPVYYATKHATITVINPRGVNTYRKANLTGKVKNYRQGTVIRVKRIVKHNLTTRFVLTNGDYITANRKLVNMGRHKQVKSVKTKQSINRYSNVNFTKKNQSIAKNRTLKVYGYDYSQGHDVSKHGTLRYRVAGGYVTANTKYVRAYK